MAPHNNAAERALRHGVIWRKTSHGTDSEAGSRFVGRVLSVVATCRQRGCDVLGFLTECFRARLDGRPAPSLIGRARNADSSAVNGYKLFYPIDFGGVRISGAGVAQGPIERRAIIIDHDNSIARECFPRRRRISLFLLKKLRFTCQ